ncbi:MAG: universal stress protein [Acidobacteria bacterium]|nr:universal stress protein [Acidobacteriota bacterium]
MKAIVVGYDGSECARRALERAAELSGDGETLHVVAARQIMPHVRGGMTAVDPIAAENSEQALEEAGTMLRERGIATKLVEASGDPATALIDEAKAADADLIVVGTHGRGLAGRSLLGSVSTSVVHHAPCDVLVVR